MKIDEVKEKLSPLSESSIYILLTRNSISEVFTQLESLYNNSINMLCTCEKIYRENKEREIEEILNNYMKPFPAYTKGKRLFKNCFSPHKITVFGIKKDDQDLYNTEHLKDIIEKTIITPKNYHTGYFL